MGLNALGFIGASPSLTLTELRVDLAADSSGLDSIGLVFESGKTKIH